MRSSNDRMTEKSETPNAPLFQIYPSNLQKAKIAWMSCGNSVGFEVFEFIDPPHQPKSEFEYNRKSYLPLQGEQALLTTMIKGAGFFHIAVTSPDPEEACKRAVAEGGKQVGETVSMGPVEKALYLSDPWGNVVEVLSCSYEALMANAG
jgi:hypothetical protein